MILEEIEKILKKLILDMEKIVNDLLYGQEVEKLTLINQENYDNASQQAFVHNIMDFEHEMMEMEEKMMKNYFFNQDQIAIIEGLSAAE